MPDLLPGTLGALLMEAKGRLSQSGVETPGLDARLFVEHFTGLTHTDAITRPDRSIQASAAEAVMAAIRERCAGRPVHRILGYREFFGLRFELSLATLEPRPDTETLVELALPEARRFAKERGRCRILDLGTGTGAIALALLSAVQEAEAVGVDISDDALATALANADINGLGSRFSAVKSNWLTQIEGSFDLVVSNPPYIPTDDLGTLAREVRDHDPQTALDGGVDGLDFYRMIAADVERYLHDGVVAVEIGYDQKAAVAAIFAAEGFEPTKVARDLAGHDRAMLFSPAPRQ